MKNVFASCPGLGHLLPMLKLARALQNQGNDVTVTSTKANCIFAQSKVLEGINIDPEYKAQREYDDLTDTVFGDSVKDDQLFDIASESFAKMSNHLFPNFLKEISINAPEIVFYSPNSVFAIADSNVVKFTSVLHSLGRPWRPYFDALELMQRPYEFNPPKAIIDLCPHLLKRF